MDSNGETHSLEAAQILLSLNPGNTTNEFDITNVLDKTSHNIVSGESRLYGIGQASAARREHAQLCEARSQAQPPKFKATTVNFPTQLIVDWQESRGRKLLSIVGKFSLIEAICCYDDLALYLLTQFLQPNDMLKIYCVSKRFHWIVDSHLTTYMLSSARRWALLLHPLRDAMQPAQPGTYVNNDMTTLMPFHNFLQLCTDDPTCRTTTPTTKPAPIQSLQKRRATIAHPTTLQRTASVFVAEPTTCTDMSSDDSKKSGDLQDAPAKVRHVPTFRYLFLLCHRAHTINAIIRAMWLHGHRLPQLTPTILAKLWLTLDLPTADLRQALFRNSRYWRNGDIRVLLVFCMKLDMLFSDPIDGKGETSLREMMLAQRSLTVLARVLARQECNNSLSMMKHYVRWKYTPRPEHTGYSILGVPPSEIGCLGKEYWGERSGSNGVLMRPDECAMREASRRGMNVRKEVVEYLLWGYIDKKTLEDAKSGMGFGRGVDASSAPW